MSDITVKEFNIFNHIMQDLSLSQIDETIKETLQETVDDSKPFIEVNVSILSPNWP